MQMRAPVHGYWLGMGCAWLGNSNCSLQVYLSKHEPSRTVNLSKTKIWNIFRKHFLEEKIAFLYFTHQPPYCNKTKYTLAATPFK